MNKIVVGAIILIIAVFVGVQAAQANMMYPGYMRQSLWATRWLPYEEIMVAIINALIETGVFAFASRRSFKLLKRPFFYFAIFFTNIFTWFAVFSDEFSTGPINNIVYERLDSVITKNFSDTLLTIILAELGIIIFESLVFSVVFKKYLKIRRIWELTLLANLVTIALAVVLITVLSRVV